MEWLRKKNKNGSIVLISVSLNAMFTLLLMICVALQHREIASLREILSGHVREESLKPKCKPVESFGNGEEIKSEIPTAKVRFI